MRFRQRSRRTIILISFDISDRSVSSRDALREIGIIYFLCRKFIPFNSRNQYTDRCELDQRSCARDPLTRVRVLNNVR